MQIDLSSLLQVWPVLLKDEAGQKLLRDKYPWILRRHNSRFWPQCRFPREIINEVDPLRELAPFDDHIFPPLAFAVLAKSIVPGIASYSVSQPLKGGVYGPEVNIKLVRDGGGVVNCCYNVPFDDCDWTNRLDSVRVSFLQQKPYKTILGLNWVSKKDELNYFNENDVWFYQAFETNLKLLLSEKKREAEQMACEGDDFSEAQWRDRPST